MESRYARFPPRVFFKLVSEKSAIEKEYGVKFELQKDAGKALFLQHHRNNTTALNALQGVIDRLMHEDQLEKVAVTQVRQCHRATGNSPVGWLPGRNGKRRAPRRDAQTQRHRELEKA